MHIFIAKRLVDEVDLNSQQIHFSLQLKAFKADTTLVGLNPAFGISVHKKVTQLKKLLVFTKFNFDV